MRAERHRSWADTIRAQSATNVALQDTTLKTPPFDSKPTADKDATTQLARCAKCGELAVRGYGESYFCEEHWEQLHSEGVITVFSPIVEPPQPPAESFSELFKLALAIHAA